VRVHDLMCSAVLLSLGWFGLGWFSKRGWFGCMLGVVD
jgi:hypothetical protein